MVCYTIMGQIKEILQDISTVNSFVLLDIFQINATRHEFFRMPILSCRLDEISLVLIQSKVLSHIHCLIIEVNSSFRMFYLLIMFNMTAEKQNVLHQESGGLSRNAVKQSWQKLPHNLTAPIAYSANRRADHDMYASRLHGTWEIKRKETAEKRKTTEATKKGPEGGPLKKTRLDGLPTELDMDTT